MATPEDNVEKGVFEQDPHVEQLRPEPSAHPSEAVILEGLAGKSDREGWARLYFNRTLTYYAEFRREDIVFTQAIPPDQPPMLGLKATRVGIKKDAMIEYTRTTRAKSTDEFDLDVQLAAARGGIQPIIPQSLFDGPCDGTIRVQSDCRPCRTDTCPTKCPDQPTCPHTQCQTCPATCQTCATQCNPATCPILTLTCDTQCNQRTCQETCTCDTQCRQDSCIGTCDTCNRHVFTCGGGRQCI